MRMLLIRPGAIGDTLLTFPILRALLAQNANLHITFVGNSAVLPLLKTLALADNTSDFQDLRWSRLFLPTHTSVAHTAEWDTALCWLQDPDGVVEQNLHAQHIQHVVLAPSRPPNESPEHIVTYLARTAGITLPLTTLLPAFILPDNLLSPTVTQTVAIHPGSGGAHKCWPIEHFATVITALWQHNIPILLLSGPAEDTRLRSLHALLPEPPATHMLRILQNAPLLTVAAQLKTCACYLGNDSGLTHLAALLGLPTIALFGPSNPTIWHPVGPYVTVLYKPVLAHISPQAVLNQLKTILYSPFSFQFYSSE